MNWLVYHVVSGHVFFTGIALLLLAVWSSKQTELKRTELQSNHASPKKAKLWRRLGALAFILGCIAIIISSTAIPYVLYGIAGLVTVAWLISLCRESWRHSTQRRLPYGMVGVWLLAAAFELPYHFQPSVRLPTSREVTIIGDSITAGLGGDEAEATWPELLADQHDLNVQDISHMGDTTAKALKRVKSETITTDVVIVEIGGNDLLGGKTSAEYGRHLEALLSQLQTPGRTILMFELPLPPFYHEFGRVQRSLASKYGVKLIPKRVLLNVLGGSDATLDSIHLTSAGHQKMADTVWSLFD